MNRITTEEMMAAKTNQHVYSEDIYKEIFEELIKRYDEEIDKIIGMPATIQTLEYFMNRYCDNASGTIVRNSF